MFYYVSAILNRTMAPELLRKLKDGSIVEIQPGGSKIFYAILNASMSSDKRVYLKIDMSSQSRYEIAKISVFEQFFDAIEYTLQESKDYHKQNLFIDYLVEVVEEKYEVYLW